MSQPSRPAAAVLVTGADGLDLLHRVSTQFLSDLAPGDGRATLFCDFRGRLLHRAWVHHEAPGRVWLLRNDAPAADLIAFVDRLVFREDVRVEDRTGSGDAPPLPDAERFADEIERIREGHPRHGHEIAEAFTPFEIGRAHEVHLSKGCFTGQEALMRLVTYRSVRRRLARVEGEGDAPAVPAELRHDNERAGVVTSAVTIDAEGSARHWIGLAVVARAHLDDARPDDPPPLHLADGRPLRRVSPAAPRTPSGLPETAEAPQAF